MSEIKPIDEINGFQLTESGAELVGHALYLMHLGFELPVSWWSDHIVPDQDKKLERLMLVSGPVYTSHELSVFDSWKETCRLMRAYTQAAHCGLVPLMDVARTLTHKLQPGRPVLYKDLQKAGLLTGNTLRFLEQVRFLTSVSCIHLSAVHVTLAQGPRNWYYDTSIRTLDQSFDLWRDHIAMNINKYTIPLLINSYLEVNDPQRFGGGE